MHILAAREYPVPPCIEQTLKIRFFPPFLLQAAVFHSLQQN